MLSYKQWKMVNESTFALGLAVQPTVGIQAPHELGFDEAKKMSKKKSKKKMHFGGDEDEDISGDGEMVDPSSAKDSPDVDVDVDDEGGEEFGGCGGDKCGKMSKKKSKKKMWSDEDDEGEVEAPEEEEEDDDEEFEDEGGDEEKVVAKKKPPVSDEEVPLFSKKKSKKKMKREGTEEEQWWASVKSMVTSNPNQKFGDGWTEYQEDALFSPVDQSNLTQAVREPQPGEVGFAPQQKLGQL